MLPTTTENTISRTCLSINCLRNGNSHPPSLLRQDSLSRTRRVGLNTEAVFCPCTLTETQKELHCTTDWTSPSRRSFMSLKTRMQNSTSPYIATYGRKNPFSVFTQDVVGSPPQAYQLAVPGVPFPSISFTFYL